MRRQQSIELYGTALRAFMDRCQLSTSDCLLIIFVDLAISPDQNSLSLRRAKGIIRRVMTLPRLFKSTFLV